MFWCFYSQWGLELEQPKLYNFEDFTESLSQLPVQCWKMASKEEKILKISWCFSIYLIQRVLIDKKCESFITRPMENKNRRSYIEVLLCDKSFNNQLQVRISLWFFFIQFATRNYQRKLWNLGWLRDLWFLKNFDFTKDCFTVNLDIRKKSENSHLVVVMRYSFCKFCMKNISYDKYFHLQ